MFPVVGFAPRMGVHQFIAIQNKVPFEVWIHWFHICSKSHPFFVGEIPLVGKSEKNMKNRMTHHFSDLPTVLPCFVKRHIISQ